MKRTEEDKYPLRPAGLSSRWLFDLAEGGETVNLPSKSSLHIIVVFFFLIFFIFFGLMISDAQ